MNKTKIEWAKNPNGSQGYTWNPITGCNNQIDGMCKGGNFPCYAYRLAHTRLRKRYLANSHVADIANRLRDPNSSLWDKVAIDPFYPRFWPERLDDAYAGKTAMGKPKGIFTCDMSDLFGVGVPEEWTMKILNRCRMSSPHRFYLLTKQPQNLIKFSPFPDNCWVGVTATDDVKFTEAWNNLRDVQAKVKFLSFEPLLKWDMCVDDIIFTLETAGISWVIIGAQTKPTIMPKIEWVQEIVQAADKAGIPVFLKNNLELIIPEQYSLFRKAPHILRQELPR